MKLLNFFKKSKTKNTEPKITNIVDKGQLSKIVGGSGTSTSNGREIKTETASSGGSY